MNWDYWYIERQTWIKNLQPRANDSWKDPMLCAALGMLLTAILMLLAGVPDYQGAEDFTDTGVGCIDDCLDPAEPTPLEP